MIGFGTQILSAKWSEFLIRERVRFFLDQKFPSGSGVGIMGEMMLCVRPCGMVCDFCGSSLRDIVTWERFLGAIYIYTCLNCILLPSWQSTGVNQPSTWISTADAQDKSPDTPK